MSWWAPWILAYRLRIPRDLCSIFELRGPQVERLRGELDETLQPSKRNFPPQRKPLLSQVVDIPSTTGTESRQFVKKQSSGGGGHRPEAEDTVADAAFPSDEQGDQENCSLSSAGDGSISPRSCPLEAEAAKDKVGQEQQLHRRRNLAPDEKQQQKQQQPSRSTTSGSSGRNEGTGRGQGRRKVRTRQGEPLVSSRARAGLLGVLGPGGGRGYLAIDGPIATGSSTSARARGRAPRDASEGDGGRVAGGETL